LSLVEALHQKWLFLKSQLSLEQWVRKYFHPEENQAFMIKESALIYEWHGNHHLTHITGLKERMEW